MKTCHMDSFKLSSPSKEEEKKTGLIDEIKSIRNHTHTDIIREYIQENKYCKLDLK